MDCEVRRLMKKLSGRPVALAEYMLSNHATVRGCAASFGLSKSTVHTVLSISVGCCGALILAEYKAFKVKTDFCFHLIFLDFRI